jgi:hypothetical protein
VRSGAHKPSQQFLDSYAALCKACAAEGLLGQPKRNVQPPCQLKSKAKASKKKPKNTPALPIHDGRKDQRDLTYSDYLCTQHWSITRTKTVKAAGYKCQQCGATGKLNVHHLSYARLWFEYPADLRVLCETCHAITHSMFIYS